MKQMGTWMFQLRLLFIWKKCHNMKILTLKVGWWGLKISDWYINGCTNYGTENWR